MKIYFLYVSTTWYVVPVERRDILTNIMLYKKLLLFGKYKDESLETSFLQRMNSFNYEFPFSTYKIIFLINFSSLNIVSKNQISSDKIYLKLEEKNKNLFKTAWTILTKQYILYFFRSHDKIRYIISLLIWLKKKTGNSP